MCIEKGGRNAELTSNRLKQPLSIDVPFHRAVTAVPPPQCPLFPSSSRKCIPCNPSHPHRKSPEIEIAVWCIVHPLSVPCVTVRCLHHPVTDCLPRPRLRMLYQTQRPKIHPADGHPTLTKRFSRIVRWRLSLNDECTVCPSNASFQVFHHRVSGLAIPPFCAEEK